MRPEVGQVINGKYRLTRLLGDGGMGSVFEARHEKLGVTVALKFLHPELSKKGGLGDRFLQEARASAQVRSTHVIGVTDVDQTPDETPFIVLEYLEGRTLQNLYEDYHRTGQRLSYVDALDYAMQMVDGLEAAHASGVIHRDLKPENVMITRASKGHAVLKLLDFGIAKLKVATQNDAMMTEAQVGLTRPGVVMGTPEYMAPEQAYAADGVDARADVFSLGVILFEMLAGRRPVGGEEPRLIANAYLAGQTAKLIDFVPNVDPDLAEVVHKAMAPLAKDRYLTARALREALEPFLDAARREGPASSRHASGPVAGGSGNGPGSAPVMPPVALGGAWSSSPGAAGTINDEADAADAAQQRPVLEGAAAERVARTWPPESEAPQAASFDATRVMEPLDEPQSPNNARPVQTTPGGAANGGMTALMSGLEGSRAPAPAPAAAPALRPRKKKRGMSPLMIGGIAGGAIVVIGGIALLMRASGSAERDASPRQAPPPATVAAQQPLQAPPPYQPPPAEPAPPPPAAVPPPHAGPHHGGGSGPGPGAPGKAPSNLPPGFPSGMPSGMPPGFPAGLPSGLPNAPGAPSAPSGPSPSAPPAPGPIPGLPPFTIPTGMPAFPFPAPPPAGQPPPTAPPPG